MIIITLVQLGTFGYYQYLRLNLYSHVETDKSISHPLAARQSKFLKMPSGRLFLHQRSKSEDRLLVNRSQNLDLSSSLSP